VSITDRHLRAFVTVADELHFGRAAQKLYVAQPALTHTIQQLEQRLGVRLFDRTTRVVKLTDAGRELLVEAQSALASIDAIEQIAARHAHGRVGTIRLGYLIGAGIDLIPKLVHAFQEQFPDVALETREFDFSDPTAGLARQLVDVAIVRPPIDARDVDIEIVSRERRIAVLPSWHRLANETSVSVGDLLADPIVAAPESAGVWRDYWILSEFRGETPAIIGGEAATREAELQAVAVGRGISVTSEASVRYFDRPGVVYIPIEDIEPCSVALAWRSELTDTPAVGALRELAGELSRQPAA
jgi:DNA-binding transcriptional LysR family regulator